MHEEWWERPTCFICNHWWWMLLLIVLALAAYFSRAYWLPSPVDLCFSGQSSIPLHKALPRGIGNMDVLFAFDQSGSMADVIAGAQQDATRLMKSVAARFGSQRFGVAGFSDYVDFPYRLYQPLTDDLESVQAAINGLSLVDGGDIPEAYGRLTYESYSDPAVGWRADARRYLVIFGDSYPHDPDPGRDGQLGTPDDLQWSQVLEQLATQGIELIYVASPAIPPDVASRWSDWVSQVAGITIDCAPP